MNNFSNKFRNVKRTYQSFTRTINRNASDVNSLLNTVDTTFRTLDTAIHVANHLEQLVGDNPTIKSISGATSLYLPKIQKDFPQFHPADAENETSSFLKDYIHIRFGKETEFKNSENTRLQFMVQKEQSGNISDIKINKIAISNYTKTREYATITYQVSLGYTLNGSRIETRYDVEYSFQLQENHVASANMTCPVCGAAIENSSWTKCLYCDTAIVKDTIFNWYITNVKEK